ncbi:MAG: hypothetical protein JOY73_00160 [Actinobacteria bacterium]|nr:hypothetical protein [Actinomycetota bacterium]
MIKSPIALGAFRKLVKELQASERDVRPVVVGGAAELARTLERELARGGDASAVRVGAPKGGAVYVHLVAGDDGQALRAARKARVPIVAVASSAEPLPYVLAPDVVVVGPGEPLPVDRIAAAVASKLGEDSAPLAARLPVLRGPVCRRIVEAAARKNGLAAAALFVPGADLPVLTLNQVRMLLRLDQAYGLDLDPRERLPEIVATIGAGFGLRAVANELLDFVPVAGWAVKGGVAYAGTRGLGEAAVRRLESLH